MEYGLIGQDVTSSYSRDIHRLLSKKEYDLLSLNEEEFLKFIETRKFKGINVTMPYKEKVIPFLDELDEEAKNTKVVNTVIKRDNKLYGYNTDVKGFEFLLNKHRVKVKGKKVLILGSGATAKTVKYVLLQKGAKEIYFVSRKKRKSSINYKEAIQKFDTQIIINTTPLGMHPNYQNETLIKISDYPYLEVCIDVVYNPLKTKLLIDAQKKGIKYITGLEMLVVQAAYSSELFHNTRYDENFVRMIYRQILIKYVNVIFIGMPSCGKSTASKNLAKALNLPRIDLDEEIEKTMNLSINEIFEIYGEEKFREIEKEKVKEISQKRGQVVSLGGGTFLDPGNISLLIPNAIVIFLNRDLKLLKKNKRAADTRPLLKQPNALDILYERRYQIYHECADIEIKNNGTQLHTLNTILEKLL